MPILHNPKHEQFCRNVVAGKSAAEAYRLAGYKADRHGASRLHHQPHISQRVEELLQARTEDEQTARELALKDNAMTLGELLTELKRIGSSSIADIVDWDAGGVVVKPKAELTEAQLATIQEIQQLEFFNSDGDMVSRRLRVRLYDKLGGLEKVAKYLNAYHQKDQITPFQIDTLLRAVLKLLEKNLGRDRLEGALIELRELSEDVFGQTQIPVKIPDGTTRH